MRVVVAVAIGLMCLKLLEPFVVSATHKENNSARIMVQQAAHWYRMSVQDSSLETKAHHAAYATAYLHAARSIASDTVLERLSSFDVHELQRSIDAQESETTAAILKQCPALTASSTKKKRRWG